jgi:hypothetical protein
LASDDRVTREGFVFLPQGDFASPGTDKDLAYFSNHDGQGKTIEELLQGDEANPTTAYKAELLDVDDPSEDGDNITHRSENGTPSMVLRSLTDIDDFSEDDADDIVHRDAVWQKLEVHG